MSVFCADFFLPFLELISNVFSFVCVFLFLHSLSVVDHTTADGAATEGTGGVHEGAVLWQTPHPQTSVVSG